MDRVNFDIVLVDIKIPGMSGEEFYREIARKAPDMMSRVIFVTGDTVSQHTRDFLEWAERPVVEKPFDTVALQRLMARELATHS